MFRLLNYWGDIKDTSRVMGSERQVPGGYLTEDHPIFNQDNEENASTVVITTPFTYNERHGPKSRTRWLKKKKGTRPDKLQGVWGIMVIDEAHMIKNEGAEVNAAIVESEGDFHCTITGTPMENDEKDTLGYVKLFETKAARDAWLDEKLLRKWGVTPGCNPFELPDNHPAACLRLTCHAVDTWIVKSAADSVQKGQWLTMLFSVILLRRSHASRLPFNSPTTIGENLPRVNVMSVRCKMTDSERDLHMVREDRLLQKLTSKGASTRHSKWSFPITRKLNCLTASPALLTLEEKGVNIKAGAVKKTMNDPNFMKKWAKALFPEENLTDPQMLSRVCEGAPKLRALLINIRSQVSCIGMLSQMTQY